MRDHNKLKKSSSIVSTHTNTTNNHAGDHHNFNKYGESPAKRGRGNRNPILDDSSRKDLMRSGSPE